MRKLKKAAGGPPGNSGSSAGEQPAGEHSAGEQLAPRLREFESAVEQLGTTGGGANPERTWARLGLAMLVLGVVIAVSATLWRRGDIAASDATNLLSEIVASGNGIIFVALGLAMALTGGIVWLRNSLTRYLRHWLIRLIYEDRANTDRIIEAINRTQDP